MKNKSKQNNTKTTRIFDPNWNKTMNNGKKTFAGVIDDIYDSICKSNGWKASSTINNNLLSYNNIIIPSLAGFNTKSVDEFDLEDVDNAIQSIIDKAIKNNKIYSDTYLRHLRDLYLNVFRAAAEKYDWCPDNTWADPKDINDQDDESPTKRALRLRRSFTYIQEAVIFISLTSFPADMPGQLWGLLLMYAFGLRNNEAVVVKFSDFRIKSAVPILLVMKSTTGYDDTTETSSGKTPNADRELPVPDIILDAIQARKAKIKSYIISHPDQFKNDPDYNPDNLDHYIDNLPVACKDLEFFTPISSRQLSNAGRDFFRRTGCFEPEQFAIADELVHSELYNEDEDGYRDPTAYVFRRNWATHLIHCGLSPAERFYAMGHKIEKGLFTRNEYINDNRLAILYQKMSQRPLLNKLERALIIIDCQHPLYNRKTLPYDKYIIRTSCNCIVRIDVESNEPDDQHTIKLRTKTDNTSSVNYILQDIPLRRISEDGSMSELINYTSEFDILREYQDAYLSAYKTQINKQAKAHNNEEGKNNDDNQ